MLALLAQAAEQQSPFGSFGLLIPAALFFVIFYFIVMRPQSKQAREHKDFIDKLSKGDEVVTAVLDAGSGDMTGQAVAAANQAARAAADAATSAATQAAIDAATSAAVHAATQAAHSAAHGAHGGGGGHGH